MEFIKLLDEVLEDIIDAMEKEHPDCDGNCEECEYNPDNDCDDVEEDEDEDDMAFLLDETLSVDELNLFFLENEIKNVYFNEEKKTTTIKMTTGEVVTVRCTHGDTFDKEVGVKTAMLKYLTGCTGKFNDVVNYWVENGVDTDKKTKKTKVSKKDVSKLMEEINKTTKKLYEAKEPYTDKED